MSHSIRRIKIYYLQNSYKIKRIGHFDVSLLMISSPR